MAFSRFSFAPCLFRMTRNAKYLTLHKLGIPGVLGIVPDMNDFVLLGRWINMVNL